MRKHGTSLEDLAEPAGLARDMDCALGRRSRRFAFERWIVRRAA